MKVKTSILTGLFLEEIEIPEELEAMQGTAAKVHQDDIVEKKETAAEKMIIKKYPMNHISK